MKRRDAIKSLYATPPEPELAAANSGQRREAGERVRAGPVRTMGLALGRLEEESRALQDALAGGNVIVELDPNLVEPSPVRDRLDAEVDFAPFRAAIEAAGQQVPILVRPHPERDAHYQVAYGHRRLRAARELGRTVRAVVRAMSDDALVVAQGVENAVRQDLSYVERALFARRLEARGFARATIMEALATDKTELSKLLSVAHTVPEWMIHAIGPAPKTGRRRWLVLAENLGDAPARTAAEAAARNPALAALGSDARFLRVLTATAQPPARSEVVTWRGEDGRTRARVTRSGTTVHLAIERDPAFAAYIAERFDALYADYRALGRGAADVSPRPDEAEPKGPQGT